MGSAGMGGEPGRVAVTVVHAPACHFCADADRVLGELASEFPLTVTRVDTRSAEGTSLARTHRAPMSPLVLVDGELFSWGRLPARKLRRLLERRRVGAAG